MPRVSKYRRIAIVASVALPLSGASMQTALAQNGTIDRVYIDGKANRCESGDVKTNQGCMGADAVADMVGDVGTYSGINSVDGEPASGPVVRYSAIPKNSTCSSGAASAGSQSPLIGNPVLPSTGNKVETTTDFPVPGSRSDVMTRTWNQNSSIYGMFGWHTSTVFDRHLWYGEDYDPETGSFISYTISIFENGSQEGTRYYREGGGGIWRARGPASANDYIVVESDGRYTHYMADGAIEKFSQTGALLELRDAHGEFWKLQYSQPDSAWGYFVNPTLTRATHSSGRFIQFQFTNLTPSQPAFFSYSFVTKVTDTAGSEYNYGYSGTSLGHFYLASVTYPSSSAGVIGTSGVHTIQYDISGTGQYLGKLINGVRFSTFTYSGPYSFTPLTSEHAGGVEKYTFEYLVPGVITRVKNPLGQYTTYTFDADGTVTSTDGAAGTYCAAMNSTAVVDKANRTVLKTDENGYKTKDYFDSVGNLIQREEGYGTSSPIISIYQWGAAPVRLLSMTTPYQKVEYTYTTNNRMASSKVTDLSSAGAGRISTTTYSYQESGLGNGLLTSKTVDGPLPGSGDAVTYSYNSTGDLISVQSASGTTQFGSYTGHGLPQTMVEPSGNTVSLSYDARGQLLSQTSAGGTSLFAYTALGEVSQHQNELGALTKFTRDAAQRIVSVQSPDTFRASLQGITGAQGLVSLTLDNASNVLQQTYSASGVSGTASSYTDFDELSRVRANRGNNGQKWTYAHNAGGRVQSVTDATNALIAQYQYDDHGRVSSTTNAENGTTFFARNLTGDVTSITDPRGMVTYYTPDGSGNVNQIVSPDTGTTNFEYDTYGRRTKETRADGTVITMTYLADGRLSGMTSTRSGQSIGRTYSYDSCTYGAGRLCAVTESTGESVAYTYTIFGAVQTQTDTIAGQAFVTRWDYTAAGLPSQLTYPNGTQLSYSWQDGKVRRIRVNAGGGWTDVVSDALYQPFGALEKFKDLFNTVRGQSYDTDARLVGISGVGGNQTFSYDTRNNITTITGADIYAAGYDAVGRLNYSSDSDGSSNYSYDLNGSRQYGTYQGAGSSSYTLASNSNRLSGIASSAGSRSFSYDAVGNLTQDQRGGTTDCHRYDVFGRMSQFERYTTAINCSSPGANPIGSGQYRFNGHGQRSYKTANGTSTRFVYGAGGELLYEVPSAGNPRAYVWFGGKIVALVQAGQISSVYSDHIGRPRKVLDSAGTLRWEAKNLAFDRQVRIDSIGGLNVGFPGQYIDDESGLWQNWHRTYDGSIGRYIQSDPIGLAGGINTYAYVGGNPIDRIDPTGLKTFGECETAGFFGEAQQQSLLEAYVNHNGGKYDFAFNANSQDRWTISGRTYNAHEFGNVLAGYTGGFIFPENVGKATVSAAGFLINLAEQRSASDGDASSRPYIDLGVRLGARDRLEGRLGGVCSCGAAK